MARAHGSYPWCRWFKSSFRYEERGLNFRSLLFFAPRVLDKKNKGERNEYCVYTVAWHDDGMAL